MNRSIHRIPVGGVLLAVAMLAASAGAGATIVKKLDPAAANEARELLIALRGAENTRDAYLRLLAAPGDVNARKAQADALNAAVATLTRLEDLADQLIRRQSVVTPKFTIRTDMRLMQVGDGWAIAFEAVP